MPTGFSTNGEVRLYPAQDLLRAAQVGAMPEARLELNIYALMQQQGIKPDSWLNDDMQAPQTPSQFAAVNLDAILAQPATTPYQPTQKRCGYLEHRRSVFAEWGTDGECLATQALEFVLPATASQNVTTLLPIALGDDQELYAGLELRELPAPQLREGNARILTVPAFRLPGTVVNLDGAAAFTAERLHANTKTIRGLGEGYFSSIGVTPERIYPMIAAVDAGAVDQSLKYVKLRELFMNVNKLRDAHLMISTYRSVHALGLWSKYTQPTLG